MHPNRIRGGALAWLLTLQFFVVETLAQLRLAVPYSRIDDVISALGTAGSPARVWLNASLVLQGLLIAAGAVLLRPLLRGAAGLAATVLLGVSAAGVLLVGAFPSDVSGGMHAFGVVLHLFGGGLGLIALAYALRARSEALGTTLALLGLIGTGMTIFFLTGATYLGVGGTERAAVYVLPLGLALAGAALWRTNRAAPAAPVEADRAARRAERERARIERADRARARDEALETAAGRRSPDDDEDPWAPPSRGRGE